MTLYREMSPEEYKLWKDGKFDQLGKDWGHGTPVVHFSTDATVTTAALGRNAPEIAIQVRKNSS